MTLPIRSFDLRPCQPKIRLWRPGKGIGCEGRGFGYGLPFVGYAMSGRGGFFF